MSIRTKLRAARRRLKNEVGRILRHILRSLKKRAKEAKPVIVEATRGIVEGSVAILKDRAWSFIGKLAKKDWSNAKKKRSLIKWIMATLKEDAAVVGEELRANAKANISKGEADLVHLLLYRWWKNKKNK